MNSLLKKKKIW